MLKHNPFVIMMICLSALMLGIILVAGCNKQLSTPVSEETGTAAVAPEGSPAWVGPFRNAGDAIDAAKGSISEASADNLSKFYVSGLVLLLVAVGVKLFTGSWRDAFMVSALGMFPSIGAILLTDYPRVVLLIPSCGLALLATFGIQKIVEWWTGYRAFKAAATAIEQADTGKRSLGQLVKDRFAELGIAPVLDKALKPLEKIWKKEQSVKSE